MLSRKIGGMSPETKCLGCHGTNDGFLNQAPNCFETVTKIKLYRLGVPAKSIGNVLDQDPCIVEGDCCSDSIGVSHNVVNELTHVVSRVRVGNDAGSLHSLLDVLAFEKMEGTSNWIPENTYRVVCWDSKPDGMHDDRYSSFNGAEVGAIDALALLNGEVRASFTKMKVNMELHSSVMEGEYVGDSHMMHVAIIEGKVILDEG